MKCSGCEGFKGYQPLYGPFEPCEACAGTGEAKQHVTRDGQTGTGAYVFAHSDASIAAGNLVVRYIPPTIVRAPVWHALPTPKRFRDEMPPDSAQAVLIWGVDAWIWLHRYTPTWEIPANDPDLYWLPQPPPPTP